ncbi:hypothetical protein SBOR_8053 [Sclerotinia borealis F-4128]|uniref:Uncharacterized protein n=1 Tax=Sclerotinia borealis (strain F-4128) TaxID=1432307 RepID=W9C467_SCLBF|nr:hypothetical protein SBOR_8053 [Sclerotinia borealis F-4128]
MTSIPLHLDDLDDENPWDIGVDLFNVFNDLIQPSASQLSVHEAAEKINMLHPDNEQEDGLYREAAISFTLEMDDMHVKLASQILYQRPEMDKLVDLFFDSKAAFVQRERIGTKLTGGVVEYNARAMIAQNDQPQDCVKYRNLSSFLARLAKAGFEDSNMLYAFIALHEAMEFEFEASNVFHVVESEYLVPIAAEWIIKAGELISLNGGTVGGYARKRGQLWKGEPTLCLKRWQFWTSRFELFASCEALTEETRNAAKEAAEKMRCIKELKYGAEDV